MSAAYVMRGTDVPCLRGKAHGPTAPDIEINAKGLLTGRTRVRCKVCGRVIVNFAGHYTATYQKRTGEQ